MSNLTTEYRTIRLEDLGLIDDPFKLNADPRYLYLAEDHLTTYRRMQSVINSRRGLAVVTGAPGVGKSSLARRIFDLYYGSDDQIVTYIPLADFSSKMDAARSIASALPRLNIALKHSYTAQIEELQNGIVDAYRQKKNIVVLLDDAQLMARSAMVTLHALYNFDYDQKAVQVLVFGQDEVMQLFSKYPALNSRIYVRSQLEPLSLTGVIKMISFRLQVAGRKEPLLDESALTRIYELSNGLPREIVRLCSLATDYILDNNLTLITEPVIKAVEPEYASRRE